jgi:hypothetical protein
MYICTNIKDTCSLNKAQWLLYVPAGLTFKKSTFYQQSTGIFSYGYENKTAIISLYGINLLVSIMETECVYWAVPTASLKTEFLLSFPQQGNFAYRIENLHSTAHTVTDDLLRKMITETLYNSG